MFLIYIIDFNKHNIPAKIEEDPEFKEKIIVHAKEQLNELRKIDNVIQELLRSDEFNFHEQMGIYAIQNLSIERRFDIEFGEITFSIRKGLVEKLLHGFRILFVPECTIFVPVLASPKWVKGLIREKDFELQIYAPGFTVEEEKFHLEVCMFESEQKDILRQIADGRLLVLYMKDSVLR